MTVDALEKRLQELDVETPDAGLITARVLSRNAPPRRRGIPRLATAPLALVAMVVLVAYFAPAADIAIAERSHWSGEILQWAGLVGASDRITAVNEMASSSGYRLTLQGAYADSSRTVLIMHSDPAIASADGFSTTLTDQFARTYHFSGSVSNTLTGDLVMTFEPLQWPDSLIGARIALHARKLTTSARTDIDGTWDLTAALGVDAARPLPPPAPGDIGPAHVRFTSVTYTPATIEIRLEVTGVSGEELSRRVPNGGKGEPVFLVEIIDPNGQLIGGSFTGPFNPYPNPIEVSAYRQSQGGRYLVLVSYYGYGSFTRPLTVP